MRLINLDTIKPIDFPSCEMDGLDVVRYLDALPTVDAVEVVHGRWKHIHISGFGYIPACSECGWHDSETNYCPNCGAKMDGDGNA